METVDCEANSNPIQEGTSEMQRNAGRPKIAVTTGGQGVAAHGGARLLCELAEELGLGRGLSEAMAPTKKRRRGHDRGQVLVDLAVAIADGATTISDLRVLADQPALFGEVASVSTTWRTLEAVDGAALARIASARATARAQAWAAGLDPGFYVIDLDATLVGAHSDKEGAAPNYKHGFGFSPMMAFLDATGEPLAALLRPGNAAPGNAEDHVIVLDDALAQLPVDPKCAEVIARADAAGCSHTFTEACQERGVRFIVGHPLSAEVARVVTNVPKKRWCQAVSADGTEDRESGEVAEISDVVDLSAWGPGTRMIARRELPHPGAQLTFSDVEGFRYQVFITDHEQDDVCFLDGLYRGRGRCERAICDAKDTGLANLPSASFAINAAWLTVVLIAGDLLVWMKGLCLEGELARAEPKRLRYTLLHAAGLLVRSARRTTLRIADGWPWAHDLVAAFARLPHWSSA
jgi:Transposase DDE domain group 1